MAETKQKPKEETTTPTTAPTGETGAAPTEDKGQEKKEEQSSGGSLISKLLNLPSEGKSFLQELKSTSDSLADSAKELKEQSEVKVDSTFVENSTKLIGSLNFDDLIANPLRAAIKAQRDMSKETLAYIKEAGLITDGGESKVAVVSMNYMKDGKKYKMQIPLLSLIPIPSLGITEMKFDFKVAVDAQSSVVQTYNNGVPLAAALIADDKSGNAGNGSKEGADKGATGKGDGKGEGKSEAKNQGGEKGATSTPAAAANTSSVSSTVANIAANYSSKKDSAATRGSKYSVQTTMDINITAKQYDLPCGLQLMLDNLGNSVEEINTNGELNLTTTAITLTNGQGVITASYRNGDGVYEPSKIEVTPLLDGGDTVKLISGDEVLILFGKAGTYVIKAGKLQNIIFVS